VAVYDRVWWRALLGQTVHLVNLAEFKRLNVLDDAVARLRPGEAGAAAELQNYLGGSLQRVGSGTAGDFKFVSGASSGKKVDFMLTPDSFAQAMKINQNFEMNFARTATQIQSHVGKVELVPIDTRFLSERNAKLLTDYVDSLPKGQQSKIILFR
jgi:filamentous hemagglutinin